MLTRLILSWDVAQSPSADAGLGDVAMSVPPGETAADAEEAVADVVLDRFWLPHAVMVSPHAATANTPRMTERLRAAALVGQWQAARRSRASRTG